MSGHGRFGPNAAPIYVVGHVNPDTDAVASAVGYAWLLARETHQRVAAARAGTLRPQTTWALQRLGLDAPVLLVDAAPRFGSVARRLESVEPDRPLGDAWSVLQGSPAVVAPVVDQAGRPFGRVTGPSLLAFLAKRVGTAPVDRVTTLGELFDAPCSEAVDREVPVFRVETRIRDAVSRVLREERDDFWVVDDLGRQLRRQDERLVEMGNHRLPRRGRADDATHVAADDPVEWLVEDVQPAADERADLERSGERPVGHHETALSTGDRGEG